MLSVMLTIGCALSGESRGRPCGEALKLPRICSPQSGVGLLHIWSHVPLLAFSVFLTSCLRMLFVFRPLILIFASSKKLWMSVKLQSHLGI